MTFLVY